MKRDNASILVVDDDPGAARRLQENPGRPKVTR